MNKSELNYLTGCLGIVGETNEKVIREAVDSFGPKNQLHYSDESEGNKAGVVFNKLFKGG